MKLILEQSPDLEEVEITIRCGLVDADSINKQIGLLKRRKEEQDAQNH